MDIYKEQYQPLAEKLQASLPLKAFPIRDLVQVLRKNDPILTLKTELTITNVFNSGDISGIMCTVEHGDVKGFACALTHLNFSSSCPLFKGITDYQKKRAKRVVKLMGMGLK